MDTDIDDFDEDEEDLLSDFCSKIVSSGRYKFLMSLMVMDKQGEWLLLEDLFTRSGLSTESWEESWEEQLYYCLLPFPEEGAEEIVIFFFHSGLSWSLMAIFNTAGPSHAH